DKLDGLFKDFQVFVELTKQLTHAHEAHKKEAENFDWETI
ncbi:MAG: NADPH-dependent FMN reductase, partial [Tetragenococcus koreensis]|nr:NADPH-dependent FMN reductase [Tetragenococcus koreensis]